jgi:hypothetical protein
MPWTAKQQKTARAVKHGWKPTGSAKGFTRRFASEVVAETAAGVPTKPPVKAKKRSPRLEHAFARASKAL